MKDFSYITSSHPAYIESLYQDFVKDPNSVDPEMKKFFEGFDFAVTNAVTNGANGKQNGTEAAPAQVAEEVKAAAPVSKPSTADTERDWMKEIRVYRLILGYRNKGHLIADTNPIRKRRDRGANLDLAFALEKPITTGSTASKCEGLGINFRWMVLPSFV